jgi:transposase InsO family protein
MGLPRSTFYDGPTAAADDAEIVACIVAICDEFEAYGYRRVGAALRQQGVVVNANTIRRLMRENDLQPKQRRRFVATTDSDHESPLFPDLAKDMVVDGPNQLWVTDITYIAIATGFVYLAAILDAWSRRVVGYAISRSVDARLTLAALKAAIQARQPPKGCVHHSDGMRASLRQSEDQGQFPGGLTLTAMDRRLSWHRRVSRCGLTRTLIDQPCLSPDLSAARERPAVRFCLADACDPRRA